MIPDNKYLASAGLKVIFVLQSNDSILQEMNRYLADVIGPANDYSYFVSSEGYQVAAKMWATLRTDAPYVENLVTLQCDVGMMPEGADKKAFLRKKFVDRQYKDSRVSLHAINQLPM